MKRAKILSARSVREVTVLLSPAATAAFCLVGAGHCSQALAKLANECGFAWTFSMTARNARAYIPSQSRLPIQRRKSSSKSQVVATRCLVLVSRNYHIDREALRQLWKLVAWLHRMIGSKKK